MPGSSPGMTSVFRGAAVTASIREREGFAPAVSADLAGDHLAVLRWLKQRAHSAAIKALRRVLVCGLLLCHLFRCFSLRNPKQPPCRYPLDNRAYYLSPRPVQSLFDHGAFLPTLRGSGAGHCSRSNWFSERAPKSISLRLPFYAVLASGAKQSTARTRLTMDCFVASLLAMTSSTDPRFRGARRPNH